MDETIKIKCPCCESVLVIRRRDGKLLETREPILKESTGDRFEDAFEKVRGRSKEVENKVAEAKRKEQERLKGADDFFKQALERAKKSDDELHNPMDFD
jgi:ribosomal protein RSM22 (predicted rRNA methylase)